MADPFAQLGISRRPANVLFGTPDVSAGALGGWSDAAVQSAAEDQAAQEEYQATQEKYQAAQDARAAAADQRDEAARTRQAEAAADDYINAEPSSREKFLGNPALVGSKRFDQIAQFQKMQPSYADQRLANTVVMKIPDPDARQVFHEAVAAGHGTLAARDMADTFIAKRKAAGELGKVGYSPDEAEALVAERHDPAHVNYHIAQKKEGTMFHRDPEAQAMEHHLRIIKNRAATELKGDKGEVSPETEAEQLQLEALLADKYKGVYQKPGSVAPVVPVGTGTVLRPAAAAPAADGRNVFDRMNGVSAAPAPTSDKKYLGTPLTPLEEEAFQQWKGRFAPEDSGADYDLRGAFKEGITPDGERGHFPDTYKLPNHPTFSRESKYSIPERPGGEWGESNGHPTFTPSLWMVEDPESAAKLRSYFKRAEPDAELVMPTPAVPAEAGKIISGANDINTLEAVIGSGRHSFEEKELALKRLQEIRDSVPDENMMPHELSQRRKRVDDLVTGAREKIDAEKVAEEHVAPVWNESKNLVEERVKRYAQENNYPVQGVWNALALGKPLPVKAPPAGYEDQFGYDPTAGAVVGNPYTAILGRDQEKVNPKFREALGTLKAHEAASHPVKAFFRAIGGEWTPPNYGKVLADLVKAKAVPTAKPAAAPANLPRVTSLQEAAKLPPGTKFIGPDGLPRIVPSK